MSHGASAVRHVTACVTPAWGCNSPGQPMPRAGETTFKGCEVVHAGLSTRQARTCDPSAARRVASPGAEAAAPAVAGAPDAAPSAGTEAGPDAGLAGAGVAFPAVRIFMLSSDTLMT
jgi:hypothetical protein